MAKQSKQIRNGGLDFFYARFRSKKELTMLNTDFTWKLLLGRPKDGGMGQIIADRRKDFFGKVVGFGNEMQVNI